MAHVLLLETDRQLANTAKRYFSRAGYQLSYYVDPQAAISAADSQPPDVIIINLLLASRSGIEFLYELRSYPEWHNIPVIIIGPLPAAELQAFQAVMMQLNIAKYIQKQNSSLADLLAEVEAILQPANV